MENPSSPTLSSESTAVELSDDLAILVQLPRQPEDELKISESDNLGFW
jgi:hypothetical protein